MKPNTQQFNDSGEESLRRYDYDGETLLVGDLGVEVGETSVDVVDGTAIVVTDAGEQFEFAVPAGATATINNGVLTIEVRK